MGPKCFQMTVERTGASFSINQKQNQKSTETCTRDFSRALSKLQLGRHFDWFIALFAPVLICRGNFFGICFSTVI